MPRVYAPGMPRLLFFAAVIGLVVWRARALERYDRANGFGRYADVKPVVKESGGS